jgi:hypothetical protein
MKFRLIIETFKERMTEANVLLLFLLISIVLIIISFIMWRWGAGFLLAMSYIFTGLLLIRSSVLGGLVLMARFPFVMVLALYALLSRKNRIHFSKAAGVLALLPLVMLINSPRAIEPLDAFGQSILFSLFFIGLILGGQKILGDARGRSVFTKIIVMFTIVMTCIQIPFWSSGEALFAGAFETTVGFMIIGTTGVIVLVWFALKQKFGSTKFVFYALFSTLTFILMLLTGGRTAIGAVLLGILVLLIRRLRRNIVILLATVIILAPIGLRIIVSFPGFEAVKSKFFQTTPSGRAELWALAWDEIKAKPLIGWGTGMSSIKSQIATGTEYHQSYLQFAVDHGIPFAVVMLIAFLWLPFRGILLMRRCQTEEMKDMANLSVAILSAYTFSSYLGGVLNSTTFILPVYSAIALQEGIRAEHREMDLYGLAEYDEGYLWADHSEEILSGGFLR